MSRDASTCILLSHCRRTVPDTSSSLAVPQPALLSLTVLNAGLSLLFCCRRITPVTPSFLAMPQPALLSPTAAEPSPTCLRLSRCLNWHFSLSRCLTRGSRCFSADAELLPSHLHLSRHHAPYPASVCVHTRLVLTPLPFNTMLHTRLVVVASTRTSLSHCTAAEPSPKDVFVSRGTSTGTSLSHGA